MRCKGMGMMQQSSPPGLGLVAVEDLIGTEKVQLAMALLKHVNPGKSAS